MEKQMAFLSTPVFPDISITVTINSRGMMFINSEVCVSFVGDKQNARLSHHLSSRKDVQPQETSLKHNIITVGNCHHL